jgi:CRISPR-associated protein Cas1
MSLTTVAMPEQIPARMLNEYTYCSRLFYLEYVQGEWAHSADTLDGRFIHRRVDQEKGNMPAPEEVDDMPKLHARSVMVGSDTLGAVARIDLVENDDGRIVPVDYKRGAPPDIPEGAYEPERVQVCLQGLLLREHGYACDYGILYFAASQTRVTVEFTDVLVARTRELLRAARRTAEAEDYRHRWWIRRNVRVAHWWVSACLMRSTCCVSATYSRPPIVHGTRPTPSP